MAEKIMKLTKDDREKINNGMKYVTEWEWNQILKNQEDAEKWNRSLAGKDFNYYYEIVERLKKRIELLKQWEPPRGSLEELQKILDGKDD